MSNLNSEQMREAATVFLDSFKHVLGNYIDDSKQHILLFAAEIILREKSYMLVTQEGLTRMAGILFGKENLRDFVFTLHYVFFSRWGGSPAEVDGLILNIARGASFADGKNYSAIPKEISSRLMTEQATYEMLRENNWLAILLLIQLFVTFDGGMQQAMKRHEAKE